MKTMKDLPSKVLSLVTQSGMPVVIACNQIGISKDYFYKNMTLVQKKELRLYKALTAKNVPRKKNGNSQGLRLTRDEIDGIDVLLNDPF